MNTFYKKLSTGIVFLFILGIVVAAYYLYTLPGSIAHSLHIHEVAAISQINSAFRGTALVIGLELALGLLAIIFLLIEKQDNYRNTAYADAKKEDSQKKDNQLDPDQTENTHFNQRLKTIESSLQANFTDTKAKLDHVMKEICHNLEACQGVFFIAKQEEQKHVIELFASYAFYFPESKSVVYEFGEGLAGQVAKEGKLVNIRSVPEGYVTILSGLGSSSPNYLVIAPVKQDNEVLGVLEIASFKEFSREDEKLLNEFAIMLGDQLSDKKEHQGDIRRIAYS